MEHYNAKNSAPCLLAFVLTDLSNSKPHSRRKRLSKLNDLLHLSRSPKFTVSNPQLDPNLNQQRVHSRSRNVISHVLVIHSRCSDSQGSFLSKGLLSQALPNLDFLLHNFTMRTDPTLFFSTTASSSHFPPGY